MNLLLIFLTGLTTGGLSCLAMQGGLLASVIANQKDQEHDHIKNNKKKNKQLLTRSERNWRKLSQPTILKFQINLQLGRWVLQHLNPKPNWLQLMSK